MKKRAWLPTWKWWTGTVTAAGTVAVAALTGNGINTDTEKTFVIGLVVQRIVTWLTPSDSDDDDSGTAAA